MERKNYASVMEKERRGDPQTAAGLDPRELGPFLDAIDQYTPTVSSITWHIARQPRGDENCQMNV